MELIELCVFDFDGTIIDGDLSKYSVEAKEAHFIDAVHFKTMVLDLVEFKIPIAVATFTSMERVLNHMKLLFGEEQQYFTEDNVMVPSMFAFHLVEKRDMKWCNKYEGQLEIRRYRDNYKMINKNTMILELMNKYRLDDKTKVLFFDDDEWNILKAQALGFARAVHCPNGLSSKDLQD